MVDPSQAELVELILARLKSDDRLSQQFRAESDGTRTRFAVVDDLLPPEIVAAIYAAFPEDRRAFRELRSFRERKATSKGLDDLPPILGAISFALQDPAVVAQVGRLTGIAEQQPDPSLYAGGLSLMERGDYLHPHIDNSHDRDRRLFRTLNLLYYVTPDWPPDGGGDLELWDDDVTTPVTIHARCNRLVLMATDRTSWHSVSPVAAPGRRCCVSSYYFSPRSPDGDDRFHVTSYRPRPGAPATSRLLFAADAAGRSLVRKVRRQGLAKDDVYRA